MDLVDRRQSAQVLRPDQLVLPLTRGGGKPHRTVQESLASHCPRLLSKIFKSAWMTLGNSSTFGPIVDPGGAGDGRPAGPRYRRRTEHRAYQAPPVAAPLDLAQNLVHGAVGYARTLGFDPASDFDSTRDHLGPWAGQGAITFGRDGNPFFIQGPRDNSASIVRRLRRSVGPDFEYLIAV